MKKQREGFPGQRQVVLPPMVVEQERADSLASSLYVTDIGYYPQATHHYRVRTTPVSQYVLIYCVDGRGWYKLGDTRYEVQRHQFFILPPNVPHAYGAADNSSWTIYWVHFSGNHAAVYAEGMQTPQRISVAANSRIMDRIAVFEEILTTLQTSAGLEELRYASSLLHHFLASMRYLGQFRKAASPLITIPAVAPTRSLSPLEPSHDICRAAIHFMQENIENRIDLEQLAHYTGYSQSHLSALFKKHLGLSPLAYFNRLKMDYACHLLSETTLSINQISHKLGIEDQYYFSRLFSKTKGLSPTEYRRSSGRNV